MRPVVVVLVASGGLNARLKKAIKGFPDARQFIVIHRSSDPPLITVEVPAGKVTLHQINSYTPTDDLHVELLFDPLNVTDSLRLLAGWARRTKADIEAHEDDGNGFRSVTLV